MPRKVRQRKLRTWGFECACPACTNTMLESLRVRSIELDDMIEEYAEYCSDPTIWEDEKPAVVTAEEALKIGQKLIRLLRMQGLYGLELFNA